MALCSHLTRTQSNALYTDVLHSKDTNVMRKLVRQDLFFLLTIACRRRDIDHPWLYARCREIENDPDGCLDLWAREHYKSTIITFGKTIQDIIIDPDETFGIFSHTRPIAKSFLEQIKRELEVNTFLQGLFPDVLYVNPSKEAPKWSLDGGIVVKRKSNPKEATVEAHGLVDGQPTSKHFGTLIYDDTVTRESVTTPEMIEKVTDGWSLSLNLGADRRLPDGTTRPCRKRYSGTRYHHSDTYKTIIDRGAVRVREYYPTDLGKKDIDVVGKPVLKTIEDLVEKRKSMGVYIYGCLDADTQILMADWSLKPIHAVVEGDMVVGWTMENGKRSKTVPTKVIARQQHRADTVKIVMKNGQKIICTPDHKWWSGRRQESGRNVYSHAELGYNKGLTSLCQLLDLTKNTWPTHPKTLEAAAYLAGIFDGEGSVSMGTIHIHQCERSHPQVCNRIRETLQILGFDFNEFRPKGREQVIDFALRGGRQERFRFLMLCDPAKRYQVVTSMFGSSHFCHKSRIGIESITPESRRMVYNIETETGNYIANGFASKNCQMLQDPTADKAAGFNIDWLRYYAILKKYERWNFYLMCDPASEKKKTSDYTVFVVIGMAEDGNYYLVDGVRDKMNLTERTAKLFELHRKWQPKNTGYEKYGMQSDIEHIEYMQEQEGYRFRVTPLGGSMPKNDRIRRLVPIFEQGRFYIPYKLLFVTQEKKASDFIRLFIDDEYVNFPVSAHDDCLDIMARITDDDMQAVFPKLAPVKLPVYEIHEAYDPMAVPK